MKPLDSDALAQGFYPPHRPYGPGGYNRAGYFVRGTTGRSAFPGDPEKWGNGWIGGRGE